MKQIAASIWKRGIVSTFLAGLFAILPIVITIAILAWVGRKIYDVMGPESWLGEHLAVGEEFSLSAKVATAIGWAIVLFAIWMIGVLVKSAAKGKVENLLHGTINQIPLIEKIYNPVSQVVGLVKGDDKSDMKAMDVVYADFGGGGGPGFLGLLAGNQTYRFGDTACHVVYIPTSPVPMSGGIIFVPVDRVHSVDMTIDDLMQIYFSLGVMSSKVVPEKYVRPAGEGA